jgi:hypothetical protein
MPSDVRATGTATRFLVAALVLAALATLARRVGSDGAEAVATDGGPCRPSNACGPSISEDIDPVPAVPRGRACPGGAYLCDGLAQRHEPMRALRFRDGRTELRVSVSWPYQLTREQGLAYQRAAVRGIAAWDGLPIPLDIDQQPPPGREVRGSRYSTPSGGRPVVSGPARRRTVAVTGDTIENRMGPAPTGFPDIAVQIVPTASFRDPAHAEPGEALTSWGWSPVDGAYDLRVSGLRVATDPYQSGTPLGTQEFAAAAAHAMGHALGLPHSSSPADVMYPGNVSITPSADDLAALRALYALPNGAAIGR